MRPLSPKVKVAVSFFSSGVVGAGGITAAALRKKKQASVTKLAEAAQYGKLMARRDLKILDGYWR